MSDVEHVSLADVEAWPRNPKGHDVAAIQASLRRFGFVAPLIRDAATKRLVAGHGRVEALLGMQAAGQEAPQGVQVLGDEWFVPARTVAFVNAQEAEAYLLADNRLTEVGGWSDAAELAAMLREMQERDADALVGTGFTDAAAGRLIDDMPDAAEAADQSGLLEESRHVVVITVDDAKSQAAVLELCRAKGWQCRVLI